MSFIIQNQAAEYISEVIPLGVDAEGNNTADISVTFNASGGTVNILIYSPNRDSYVSYPNLSFTSSEYKTLNIKGSNSIKIQITDSATDVTVEVV